MSENIVITKRYDIETEIQIDYVVCEHCDKDLGFDLAADSIGDLQIKVEAHNCEDH